MGKLNAIVLLSLKKCGRGKNYTTLSPEKFNKLVDFALDNEIGVGFDSCSSHRFLNASKDRKNFWKIKSFIEACESFRMSVYIDVDGNVYPCSFCEGICQSDKFGQSKAFDWKNGINILSCNDFLTDIWHGSEKVIEWRNFLSETFDNFDNIQCPMFEVE